MSEGTLRIVWTSGDGSRVEIEGPIAAVERSRDRMLEALYDVAADRVEVRQTIEIRAPFADNLPIGGPIEEHDAAPPEAPAAGGGVAAPARRKNAPRMLFSAEDDARLRELAAEGMETPAIAAAMGRPPGNIRQRIDRLGIEVRKVSREEAVARMLANKRARPRNVMDGMAMTPAAE